ncbi:MAG: RNA methyltransferase [Cyanobacteria bacterium]|nr:RNA methyltransferase [Cyanobacteriota bacterium]MDA0866950.1 RNA methyltransferase [Cyanobacteriota bacterium]
MPFSPLSAIRIILVAPAGPLNVGSAARVMANMGLSQLVLVNPQCNYLGAAARRMAVHALPLLEAARVVPTLPDALADCHRAIATTARPRSPETPLELPEAVLPWLLPWPEDPPGLSTALIFGPEDRGLSNAELNYAQRFLGIPSNPEYPSLNLAQAVAVCCYELGRCIQGRSPAPPVTVAAANPIPMAQMEGLYQQLETLLLKIEYLYPHTSASRMEKFRRFFNRAAPTNQELAMLRGIFRQMAWALDTIAESSSDPEKPSVSDSAG